MLSNAREYDYRPSSPDMRQSSSAGYAPTSPVQETLDKETMAELPTWVNSPIVDVESVGHEQDDLFNALLNEVERRVNDPED